VTKKGEAIKKIIMFYIYSRCRKTKLLKYGFATMFVCFLLSSCIKSGYTEAIVYDSNFASGDTLHLKGAILWKWNNQTLIGRYNNGGFELNLSNLPKHKAIEITVVPYFHDSWDGSTNVGGIDGPDIWQMYADGALLVNSTFSNSPCNSMYCLQQSYPLPYSAINNPPMTGAIQTLPGVGHCSGIDATSVYKIVKTISHSSGNLNLSFHDYLVQTNVPNKLCDESWSMSSVIVKVINTP
jgi:hypothetical protein